MELGQIVFSKAGRDKGKFFVVVEIIDDEFVKIADGDVRKLKTAKTKRIKHLKPNGEMLEKIGEKLRNQGQIFDAELRSALRPYNETK